MTRPRTSRFQTAAVALSLLFGTATQAESQTFVAGVGAGVNMEDGDSGGSARRGLGPGLSGRSAAWDWLVGLNVTERVAVVFEASMAAPHDVEFVTPDCVIRGGSLYERTHHDNTYSGMLQLRVHERFTVVGGISGIQFETTERRFSVRCQRDSSPRGFSPTVVEGPFPAPNHTGWSTGAVVGFDFLPLQWRFLTVGPSVRVFIYEHELSHSFGYGHYAVRVSGRVQARF